MKAVSIKLQKVTLIRKFEKFSFIVGGIILLASIYDRYKSGGLIPGTFGIIYNTAYIIGGWLTFLPVYFIKKFLMIK